jgi:hypothetical protein
MTKKLEDLADEMINLTPEEGQELGMIIKAKLMPEQAKQQTEEGLLSENNPEDQQQMGMIGQPVDNNMAMPTTRDVAMRGLLQ